MLSVSAFSQNDGKSRTAVVTSSSSNSSLAVEPGTRLEGTLENSIDIKKSRVGDQVIVRTTKPVKQHGETVVPKGSRLIGRIADVRQQTGKSGSRLQMVFDRIECKGLSAPISASIVSITSVATAGSVDSGGAELLGSTSTSTRASGGGSGGGLLGGVGSTVSGATGTAGGVINSSSRRVDGITNTAGQSVGTATGTLGQTLNGIQISNSTSGSAAAGTTLSSPTQNLRLEKGVTMQLQLNSVIRRE